MGLFDGWRRKQKTKEAVQLKEPSKPKSEVEDSSKEDVATDSEDAVSIVAEYERLVQRREELQVERRDLIATLDRGEIDPEEFRKELMNRIQEAATVSDNLRLTGAKLTAMGIRGVLH